MEWFTKSPEYRELDCIDGEPVELEWENFPGHTTLQLLREIQTTMEENRIQPEQFEDRILFMPMYNDIDRGKQDTKKLVNRVLQKLRRSQKDALKDTCHSSDQEQKKSGTERTPTSQRVCGITLLR